MVPVPRGQSCAGSAGWVPFYLWELGPPWTVLLVPALTQPEAHQPPILAAELQHGLPWDGASLPVMWA